METQWILGGLHSAFPIVHMDSMESPCGVPIVLDDLMVTRPCIISLDKVQCLVLPYLLGK